jgi:GntR family transcriptional regulator of vanillate catabolism
MAREGQGVVSILRDKIVSGEFPAGERLAEIPTAELLGLSRTPVRIAFRALEQEGLLIKLPRRGYRVRKVTHLEISGSIEVRGVLEGLAARQAAEKGLDEWTIEQLKHCLIEGDALFNKGYINQQDIEAYNGLNKRFHDFILQASGNPAQLDREYRRFNYAHMQHHAVFEALIKRQGTRAEAIMREHANATLSYAELFDVYGSYKLVDAGS